MAAPANHAFKRLSKEFATLASNPPPFCTVSLVNDSISHWTVRVRGPPATPYEGGTFLLSFEFPDSYPMKPPTIKFSTPIYHVNVSMKQGGMICQDIVSKDWAPTLRASVLIQRVYQMLETPNPESPLEAEIGEMLVQQPSKYAETAKQWTKKHAMQ